MYKKFIVAIIVALIGFGLETRTAHAGGEYEGDQDLPPVVDNSVTFHKDRRCHDRRPPAITWIKFDKNELLWSAINGRKIEIRFSENKNDLRWRVKLTNDGHQFLNTKKTTGILSGTYYFQARTVNGCKSGPWSETFTQSF